MFESQPKNTKRTSYSKISKCRHPNTFKCNSKIP